MEKNIESKFIIFIDDNSFFEFLHLKKWSSALLYQLGFLNKYFPLQPCLLFVVVNVIYTKGHCKK